MTVQSVKFSINHQFVSQGVEQQNFALTLQHQLDLTQGIVGVYGSSGQGKSTFLKILTGLIQSSESSVSWQTREGWQQQSLPESCPATYQDQHSILFEHLSVAQNLDFIIKHSQWHQNCPFTLQQVINWCGIAHLLSQSTLSLSGGEKQRVGLARSLLSGKPVIILDEPFSALDWQSRSQMTELLITLNIEFGIRFILVSHSLSELAVACHYLLNINSGSISHSGMVSDVLPALNLCSGEPVISRFEVTFANNLKEYHLTTWQLRHSQQTLYVKGEQNLAGHESGFSRVLVVEADKVSLTSTEHIGSSMLNQLVGTITDIQPHQHLILVSIDVDGQTLYSLVSKLSSNKLGLSKGQTVYAQFKAI